MQGYNLKTADLQGSIGLVQLKKFDNIHSRRRINKEKISEIFRYQSSCVASLAHITAIIFFTYRFRKIFIQKFSNLF